METSQGLTAAFALTIISGAIIFITGIIGLIWFGASGPYWGGFGGWMGGMMSGYHGFAGGGQYGFFSVISIVGIISGLALIVGAALLRARPSDHFMWGVFILVFALVSFVDMGGYFIGAALGLAGGALALSYRPRTSTPQDKSDITNHSRNRGCCSCRAGGADYHNHIN